MGTDSRQQKNYCPKKTRTHSVAGLGRKYAAWNAKIKIVIHLTKADSLSGTCACISVDDSKCSSASDSSHSSEPLLLSPELAVLELSLSVGRMVGRKGWGSSGQSIDPDGEPNSLGGLSGSELSGSE